MGKSGRQYQGAAATVDRARMYEPVEALSTVKSAAFAKFDETVEVSVHLGVDPRHADQMVRSSVVLPHGTGKVTRVLVFAKGPKEAEAKEAGADFVGSDDLVEKIQGGWLEFDKTVATPDMMGTVGKIGRILGPRNLMPNAKLGTVTFDIAEVVKEIKGGKVDFRVDKAGIVHAGIGKVSFGDQKLYENALAFIERLVQLKPSTSKGVYLRSISVSSTMGPGFKVDTLDVRTRIK